MPLCPCPAELCGALCSCLNGLDRWRPCRKVGLQACYGIKPLRRLCRGAACAHTTCYWWLAWRPLQPRQTQLAPLGARAHLPELPPAHTSPCASMRAEPCLMQPQVAPRIKALKLSGLDRLPSPGICEGCKVRPHGWASGRPACHTSVHAMAACHTCMLACMHGAHAATYSCMPAVGRQRPECCGSGGGDV